MTQGTKESIEQLQAELSALRVRVDAPTSTETADWWSATNAMTMSVAVLVFGLLICCLGAYLTKSGKSAEAALRLVGTIAIITATLFLIVAGYSDKQIAPAMGLLGTVVGYLLGKDSREAKP